MLDSTTVILSALIINHCLLVISNKVILCYTTEVLINETRLVDKTHDCRSR